MPAHIMINLEKKKTMKSRAGEKGPILWGVVRIISEQFGKNGGPTIINFATSDGVDARGFVVSNVNSFQNFPFKEMSLTFQNLCLVEKEVVASGGVMIRNAVVICHVRSYALEVSF